LSLVYLPALAIKPKECLRETLDVFVPDREGNLLQVDLSELFSDLPTDLSETDVVTIARSGCPAELGCLCSVVIDAVSNL
jgi:hypothetical protein